MVSSEVQRTLVKSPPELWAEISDPESLARHLGEFGDIRITRVQPEQKVEWEAADVTGTVVIKPSGWGTKVKLTVMRELIVDAVDDEPMDEKPTVDEPASAGNPVDDRPDAPESADAPDAPDLPEATGLEVVESAPRRGFFARLFDRRKARRAPAADATESQGHELPEEREREEPAPFGRRSLEEEDGLEDVGAGFEPEPEPSRPALEERSSAPGSFDAPLVAERVVPVPEAREVDRGQQEATLPGEAEPEPAADVAAELLTAEEAAAEQIAVVLTGVLDRLGAAHHRPFSRA